MAGGAATLLLIGCDGDPDDALATTLPRPSSDPSVFKPTAHTVTRWRSDPFARGSYSFMARGAEPSDRRILARPVDDSLYFAGEAVDLGNPATVHGAYQSGIDAADRVIDSGARSAVVVGAGAAGLAAAGRLSEAGVETVVVEARSRLGGRVHTDTALGPPLDLGASWIHGVRGNPLTEIADAAGVERFPTDYDNLVVRDQSGRKVDLDELPDDFVEVVEIENEYAADVDQLAPEAFTEGDAVRGGDVLFPAGYVQIIDELAADIDVELDVVVTSIEYGSSGVRVAGEAGEWEADAALVTVPLGVLKKGTITFDPDLPGDHVGAIERLGMGHLSKVYLRFPEVFWDADVEFIGRVAPERGRFALWANFVPLNGLPILMAFHGGSVADELERMSDEEIVAEAVAALRGMYG